MIITLDNGNDKITMIVKFPTFMNVIRHIQEAYPSAEKSYIALEYFADRTIERQFSLPSVKPE